MNIIQVYNLSKSFRYYKRKIGTKGSFSNILHRRSLYKPTITNISFNIDRGEIVGFLGPNGAEKTTKLKMLSGILYPSGGTATVMGFIPREKKRTSRKGFP